MKNIKTLLILVSSFLLTIHINAQTNLNSQVPLNPEIRTGKLEGIDI